MGLPRKPAGIVLTSPGGRTRGLPEDIQDALPRQVLIEYPATISMSLDLRTGDVMRLDIQAMPDRANIFDRETWHELPNQDTAVQRLIAHFDPRPHTDEGTPVTWLEKDDAL